MPMHIAISSVVPTVAGGSLISLQVTGTSTNYDPATNTYGPPCPDVEVSINCGGTVISQVVPATNNTWTAVFNATQLQSAQCHPGDNISVSACCAEYPEVPCDEQTVPCPCCNVQLSAVVDGDCVNNQRSVTINALNNCPTSVNAQLDFGDGSSPAALTLSPGSNAAVTHTYAAGTYTAVLHIPGCPDISVQLNVAPCDQVCPSIAISHNFGDCNPDGTRPVTITAVLTGASSTTPISAQMTGPCAPVSNTGAGSLTLTSSCSLNSGTYTVMVTANNCPPQTYTFNVEDCCPTVDFDHVVLGGPICASGDCRDVKVTATVKPHNGVQTTATLSDMPSGAVLATGTGTTPFMLSHTECYPDGTQQVQVSFAAPLNCPPQTYDFCVPKCESLTCLTLRNSMMVALTLFLTITIMNGIAALATSFPLGSLLVGRYQDYLYNAPLQAALGTILAVSLVAAIGLFFYWFLCIKFLGIQIGSCCRTKCTLLLTLWQVPLIVGVLLLYYLAVCWLLNLVAAILLFLIAFLFYNWWKKKCCPGRCDPGFYFLFALGLAVAQVYIILDPAGPGLTATCVKAPYALSSYVPWFVSLLWWITQILRVIIGFVLVTYIAIVFLCIGKRD